MRAIPIFLFRRGIDRNLHADRWTLILRFGPLGYFLKLSDGIVVAEDFGKLPATWCLMKCALTAAHILH